MADDYGIRTSIPGVAVSNATSTQLNFSSANPFIKLDTQKPSSFQTITLLITTDPPEPSAGGGWADTYTVVYKFAHGYTYTPSLETLFVVLTQPPSTHFCQNFYLDAGQIAGQTAFDGAILMAVADATYVYFIVDKFNSGSGSPNLLTGTNVQITVHVFVEDVGL